MNAHGFKLIPSLLRTLKKYYQSKYASPLVQLEDTDGARLTTAIVATIGVLILLFIIWISITPLEEIAATKGEIIPKSKVYSIQHLEGGVIKSILVKEGDEVHAGQILVEFDPTLPQLELQQIRARNATLIASAENLQKLLHSEHPNQFSVLQSSTPSIDSKLADSEKGKGNHQDREVADLIPSKHGTQNEQTLALKSEIAKDIAQFDSILVILKRRLGILLQEKDMYETLLKTGSVSKKDYLALLRTVTQVQEDISKTQAAHVETLYLIDKLENRINHIEVRAPIHGLIKGLQIHAGNIIQPGGILMEVVPVEDLVVEAKIHATDIGQITVGDAVKVKVTTYDYTRFGSIAGKLIQLSASTFLDEKGTPYYKALVELEKSYVGSNPKQNRLLPGMTVQADIHTGTKTILEYLLRPIEVTLNSSFKEH